MFGEVGIRRIPVHALSRGEPAALVRVGRCEYVAEAVGSAVTTAVPDVGELRCADRLGPGQRESTSGGSARVSNALGGVRIHESRN